MQHHVNQILQNQPTNYSSKNNLYCFLGGFLINLFFVDAKITTSDFNLILTYLGSVDFTIYIIRSLCGGFIALAFKLIYDFFKKPKSGGQNG